MHLIKFICLDNRESNSCLMLLQMTLIFVYYYYFHEKEKRNQRQFIHPDATAVSQTKAVSLKPKERQANKAQTRITSSEVALA